MMSLRVMGEVRRLRTLGMLTGILLVVLLLVSGCKKGAEDTGGEEEGAVNSEKTVEPVSAPWNDTRVGDRVEIRHADEYTEIVEVIDVTDTEVVVRAREEHPDGMSDPEEQRYPRRYAGDSGPGRMLSSLLANKISTSSFMIGKIEVLCDVYEKTVVNGPRRLIWRTYMSPMIPGRVVKREVSTNGGAFEVVMRVISFERTSE